MHETIFTYSIVRIEAVKRWKRWNHGPWRGFPGASVHLRIPETLFMYSRSPPPRLIDRNLIPRLAGPGFNP